MSNNNYLNLLDQLSDPAPVNCTSDRIDFEKLGLLEYKGYFATLIRNLFSPHECQALLEAAEATTNGEWAQAMINIGNGEQMLVPDVRNCGRIMWDDEDVAARLLTRIIPHLPESIIELKGAAHVTGHGPYKRKETWRLERLNERLRFLKYTNGMYFSPHGDGSYVTPDGQERSYLTIHIYLNGDDDLVGGATRFFGEEEFDVNPKTGACLVFQHRNLVHSGEEVLQGTKYTIRTDAMYRKVRT